VITHSPEQGSRLTIDRTELKIPQILTDRPQVSSHSQFELNLKTFTRLEHVMPDQFLKDLLLTPGTSGQEENIQNVVRNYVRDFADNVETDVFGNVSATINPQGTTTILLDAHCDQIGLIVKHIDSYGFIRVNPIGGWDLQILLTTTLFLVLLQDLDLLKQC
jgi:hypothetical protein